jgi:hypothetical protein
MSAFLRESAAAAAAGRGEAIDLRAGDRHPLALGPRAGGWLRCLWPISAGAQLASCPRNPQALHATPKSCSCRVSRLSEHLLAHPTA